jgi:hypothetical protein
MARRKDAKHVGISKEIAGGQGLDDLNHNQLKFLVVV